MANALIVIAGYAGAILADDVAEKFKLNDVSRYILVAASVVMWALCAAAAVTP